MNKKQTETAADEAQPSKLFPEEPPVPIFEGTLPLSDLPVSDYAASDEFVTNVQRFGVLVALTLTREKGGGYRIIDGRRRRWAAERAGLSEVPVTVFDLQPLVSESALVSCNEHRSTNWPALYDAVCALLKREPNENALARALGVELSRIRKVLTIKNLIRPLEKAWRNGDIADSVAFKAATLSTESQKALASVMKEKGGLTAADVSDARPKKPDDEKLPIELPSDRGELKKRILRAIMEATEKGGLDAHSPEHQAEFLTRMILGEPITKEATLG